MLQACEKIVRLRNTVQLRKCSFQHFEFIAKTISSEGCLQLLNTKCRCWKTFQAAFTNFINNQEVSVMQPTIVVYNANVGGFLVVLSGVKTITDLIGELSAITPKRFKPLTGKMLITSSLWSIPLFFARRRRRQTLFVDWYCNCPLFFIEIITKYLIFNHIMLKYLVVPGFGP